ncbi:MAG: YggS family pyridoxal phosphate-dependent enzyme [Candidatus Omnitrophica bacterium]|nr:YggS family pyridoxal phosphate-dependent enzyme [Candidatus Omnitrophota bacterium]
MGQRSMADIITQLKESVAEKARAVGRMPEEVKIVLVSKTVEPERMLQAFEAGMRDFGESRVQEFLRKRKFFPPEIRWHMIGHLQTNKVKQVVGNVVLIHSLDRRELYEELDRQGRQKNVKEIDCLIQVNSSGEGTKSGFAPEEVSAFISELRKDSPVKIRGLMTIGAFSEDEKTVRDCFRKVKNLRDELVRNFPDHDWGILSMGMSSDYLLAIEEGANMLRIGSAVFGARQNPA